MKWNKVEDVEDMDIQILNEIEQRYIDLEIEVWRRIDEQR
jgi:hypothetical protein